MRKLFAGVFGVSVLLAVLVGAAFAWTSSTPAHTYVNHAGTLSVDLANVTYYPNNGSPNQVYPTGNWIPVLQGQIVNNTPANPGIPVHITGGTVDTFTSPNSNCLAALSAGFLHGKIDNINGASVAQGGGVGGWWDAYLMLQTNTPNNDCQGNNINYNVVIDVST